MFVHCFLFIRRFLPIRANYNEILLGLIPFLEIGLKCWVFLFLLAINVLIGYFYGNQEVKI